MRVFKSIYLLTYLHMAIRNFSAGVTVLGGVVGIELAISRSCVRVLTGHRYALALE